MILELQHISKTYPNGNQALTDINFTVDEGEFLVIIGLSGSGKSTLLRCINRLHEPTSGSIIFRNKDVTTIQGKELRQYRRSVGMIFQHFNLIPRYSVLDNVLTGDLSTMSVMSALMNKFTDEQKQRALHNLEIVGIPDKAQQRADELSGGQQQRVAIARTLMQNPDIILADEPVASLDPATSHSVMKYLEKVNKEHGKTIICNLHFLSLVRQYATRVIALKGGKMIFQGQPEDITDTWFKTIYGDDATEVEIR
mgnify:FL=1